MIHIIGGGGHAKVVLDALFTRGVDPSAVRLRDARAAGAELELFGIPMVFPEVEPAMRGEAFHVAIGATEARIALLRRGLEAGCHAVTIIHPSAQVSRFATLGDGCFVAASAVVGPGATIGAGVIVNHGAVVDHDVTIDDYCHIAPNSTLGGGARVGHAALIGAGATVLPGVEVGEGAIVGAGAAATRSVPPHTTWVGVPAGPPENS